MSLSPISARQRWTTHLDSCAQCRTTLQSRALCPTGYRLFLSAQRAEELLQLPPQTDLDWRLVAVAGAGTAGLIAVCIMLILLLAGCAQAPVQASAQPELVRIILQTERSIQLQHDDDRIEVASAYGWAPLQTPVIACVALDGQPDTAVPRVARLYDRSACR